MNDTDEELAEQSVEDVKAAIRKLGITKRRDTIAFLVNCLRQVVKNSTKLSMSLSLKFEEMKCWPN